MWLCVINLSVQRWGGQESDWTTTPNIFFFFCLEGQKQGHAPSTLSCVKTSQLPSLQLLIWPWVHLNPSLNDSPQQFGFSAMQLLESPRRFCIKFGSLNRPLFWPCLVIIDSWSDGLGPAELSLTFGHLLNRKIPHSPKFGSNKIKIVVWDYTYVNKCVNMLR